MPDLNSEGLGKHESCALFCAPSPITTILQSQTPKKLQLARSGDGEVGVFSHMEMFCHTESSIYSEWRVSLLSSLPLASPKVLILFIRKYLRAKTFKGGMLKLPSLPPEILPFLLPYSALLVLDIVVPALNRAGVCMKGTMQAFPIFTNEEQFAKSQHLL